MLRFVFATFREELFKPPLSSSDNSKLSKVKKNEPNDCRKATMLREIAGNENPPSSPNKSPFLLPELIFKWIKVGVMFITFLFYLTFFILFMIEVTQQGPRVLIKFPADIIETVRGFVF